MEIQLTTLGPRTTRKHAAAETLFSGYRERIGHYAPCQARNYATEEKFFAAECGPGHGAAAGGPSRRKNPLLILLDSRGRTLSTERFAEWLREQRERATQRLVFAVGPPDGWSDSARTRAGLLLSLGAMTLPHELAAVVLAEQVYRAFTIIEGHPYHRGH